MASKNAEKTLKCSSHTVQQILAPMSQGTKLLRQAQVPKRGFSKYLSTISADFMQLTVTFQFFFVYKWSLMAMESICNLALNQRNPLRRIKATRTAVICSESFKICHDDHCPF